MWVVATPKAQVILPLIHSGNFSRDICFAHAVHYISLVTTPEPTTPTNSFVCLNPQSTIPYTCSHALECIMVTESQNIVSSRAYKPPYVLMICRLFLNTIVRSMIQPHWSPGSLHAALMGMVTYSSATAMHGVCYLVVWPCFSTVLRDSNPHDVTSSSSWVKTNYYFSIAENFGLYTRIVVWKDCLFRSSP